MHLRISCPHCKSPVRLSEPFPVPGTERQCTCGRALAISYPVGMVERLRARGARFEGDEVEERPAARTFLPPQPAQEPVDEDRPTVAIPGRQVMHLEEGPAPAPGAPPPPRPAPRADPGASAPAPGGEERAPWASAPAAPRRRGWRAAGVAALAFLGVGAAAAAGVLLWAGKDLPSVEQLGTYTPPTVTMVYDARGRLMGEIYEKRRYVVDVETIPKHVQQAFIAAEDGNFYDHGGVDYMGIVRAVLRNAAQGRKAQGASTITQQVARNFLLSNEKTYTRKLKEVVLSWRIEDAFDKDHVLFLYLNEIYLGSSAYGVEAAARVYFGKHAEELSVAEGAMLAGLPQRPSEYSPYRDMNAAKARQKYVLGQMVENGFLTEAESARAYDAPIELAGRTNEFLLKAPWYTEEVRKYLVATYGEDAVLNQGLIVQTPCDLDLQQVAQGAVTDKVMALDGARAGWRGPAETLAEADIEARLQALSGPNAELTAERRYDAVVLDVDKTRAVVGLSTRQRGVVALANTTWARTPGLVGKQDDLTRVLKRGDVVTVEVTHRDHRDVEPLAKLDLGTTAGEGPVAAVALYQSSEVQGALFSYRLTDGGVVAMVGGSDFKETKFNRAVQASRQVGSTFKPIVYAAAIESKKFTAGSIVPDAPFIMPTTDDQLYKPWNFGNDYKGDISLRKALALSRNVVTMRVMQQITPAPVVALGKRLGITSPLEESLATGLGAASLTIPELTRAYSPFATNGHLVDWHIVDKVTDRNGKVLEQFSPPAEWPEVLHPPTAGVVGWMLGEVATAGTAARSSELGLRVGGKTGTTNNSHDVWFVGFTRDLITTTWVGYDQPKSLGDRATGGDVALPVWMAYTKVAVPKEQDKPFLPIPGVRWVSVDETTGLPSAAGRSMPFLEGTVPEGQALLPGQVSAEDLKSVEF